MNFGKKGKGNAGSLNGVAVGEADIVDFREQAGVYVLYDGVDIPSLKVTYVGQVGRKVGDSLLGRLRNHCNDHLWNRWTRFSWFGVYEFGAKATLVHANIEKDLHAPLSSVIDHLEGVLITVLEPSLNKRGANWDGGATQYFQHEEDVAGSPLEALDSRLGELEAKIDELLTAKE